MWRRMCVCFEFALQKKELELILEERDPRTHSLVRTWKALPGVISSDTGGLDSILLEAQTVLPRVLRHPYLRLDYESVNDWQLSIIFNKRLVVITDM
eukprot:g75264.t1